MSFLAATGKASVTAMSRAEGSISISAPVTRSFEDPTGGTADLAVSGTYSLTQGVLSAVYARWAGGAWETLDASPAGGTFSGTLSARAEGQGDLEVMFKNGDENDIVTYVGVGEPIVFPYVGTTGADVGAKQGVCTDGTSFWTTGGDSNETLERYNSSWVSQDSADTSGDSPTAKAQINGIVYANSKLYIGANNWNSGSDAGWILEYNPTTLARLDEHDITTDTGYATVEGCAIRNGEFWVFYHDALFVSHFNSSWVFQASYALPATGHPSSVTNLYQGGFWIDDDLYLNVHNGSALDAVDSFRWTGSAFEWRRRMDPPTDGTTKAQQGMCKWGSTIYWAQRSYGGTGNDDRVIWTTMDDHVPA